MSDQGHGFEPQINGTGHPGTSMDVTAGVRVRLGLLIAYLVSPFDLIPDFIRARLRRRRPGR